MNMNIVYEPIEKLKPNPNNRNKHSDSQIERLCKIIQYQGFRRPISVSNQTGFMVVGHGRLLAAQKLGMTEVPVIYQDYESEDQEFADMTADNAIASWAELDLSGINTDILEHPELDLDLLGLKDFEPIEPEKIEPQCDEDEVPDAPAEANTKPGDLYALGHHRLLCGDSTNIQHIDRLMNGEKADMVFTSPPYNANESLEYNDGKKRFMYKDKSLDNKSSEDYLKFNGDIFASILLSIKDDANVFYNINYNSNSEQEYIKIVNGALSSFHLRETIIWKKNGMPSGGYHTTRVWEFIFFFTRHNQRYFQNKESHERFSNFWEVSNIGAQQEEHRACFPVGLPEMAIERYCPENGLLFEPFGGAGTTAVACEKTNRRCFMMEIDPHYCDVIVARWEKYTGKKAELINGKT